ncbi:phage portal protein [Undibacterium sp. RTI2.1]|uniref:phage portal protein n=1 Tax=unclassified Undibacterium TaxID=2630295 RepID=UPI002AB5218D|nr:MULTISPECIES: phage portal protein [unclassified Undibacterium]MDY7537672.1 phage portal protein [Undibacterium sp. 5I1]MEB0029274.1 phage portal protein [Undibacterium sp. RTI2.1]MEB0115582.1 phage portal protein [Undibacterium sp. RTI2.2]MEB0256409.1 phage portal protein [Undibacterium sp. 5I1]
MNQKFYNEARVSQPGSVILRDWNAQRSAQKALLSKATTAKRMYAGAAMSRLDSDWSALNTSADSEIITSLRPLRARSRELLRDNEYAKAAVRIIKNNVIGTGIGLQAQVKSASGKLMARFNDQIEAEYEEWTDKDTCDPAGKLCFADMERLAIGSLVENGEVIIHKIRRPFGRGKIPYALELIESDRIADQWSVVRADNGNTIRMGIEQDKWGRPVAYWLYPNHPGDYQFSAFVESALLRIPAEDIIHLYIPERIGQTRGVPWFHATLKRLRNMQGYEEAEIVAARASASIVGIIESGDGLVPDADDFVDGDSRPQPTLTMEPGTFQQLAPGEKFTGFNPSRPNSAMDPFMRFMLRAFATGIGVSYASVSSDYSQTNYSSSRLALLDDRDLWRVLQGWFIRNFRREVHRDFVSAAVLAGALSFPDYYTNTKKYLAVRFKPRGWSWIDPTKEVLAYKAAVRAGFMTVSDVISLTSEHADAEDVFKERRRELDMMAESDLVFDTDPAQTDNKGAVQGAETDVPLDAEGNKQGQDSPSDSAAGEDDTDKGSNSDSKSTDD